MRELILCLKMVKLVYFVIKVLEMEAASEKPGKDSLRIKWKRPGMMKDK